MRRPRLAAALLAVTILATGPALAESQSSNSSSNCSNGRCTRVDSLIIQDDRGGVRGWRRVEHWREGRDDRFHGHGYAPWREPRRHGRWRQDRDDD